MAEPNNDQKIKSLKTDMKRQDFRIEAPDKKKGLVLSVYRNNTKIWRYIYKKEGVKRILTMGEYPRMTLSKATRSFLEYHEEVKSGGDPAASKQGRIQAERDADTIKQLAAEYIEKWAKPRKRSWKEDQRMLDHDIIDQWGARKAKDITRRDVILLLDSIVERGSPISANRTHALLHKMFRFAVGRDIIPFNPVTDMPKPAAEHQKDRVLSDGEIKTHWQGIMASHQMSALTRYALLLQLITAQRQGEIASMRWDQINGDMWTISAERAKNGLAHRVPLSPQAITLLDAVKGISDESEYAFPSPKTGHIAPSAVGRALHRHLNKLDEPISKGTPEWFTPHDLRRTAATKMTEAGINRLTVSKILNHAESGVTAVYDRHSYDKEKQQALEAWGRRLDAILTEKKDEGSNVVNLTR